MAVTCVLTGGGDDCLGGGGLELDRRKEVLGPVLPSEEEAALREGEILKNCSGLSDLGRGTGWKVIVDDDVSKEDV